ncbi:hypothetical protein Agub_g12051 [Astrephomene gubernaculifera]|uniref:Uncharacterized protein n=1 Tax=Astrephomene gubernaculifera TaxID=47775 RepID=A0AAD3DZM7_9CHLO|nr:hypothetical protein Agub_g12051 [Astrephomene gubernaculifera]
MGHRTKVDLKIHNNYKVTAHFSCQGTAYEFFMKKWAKTSSAPNPTVSFDYFAMLVYTEFEHGTDFGTITVLEPPDGGRTLIIERSPQQVVNILKYATMDVFACAEEIIKKYRRSVLDYAIFHRQQDRLSTYGEYIHLVACDCLTHANFHAPNVEFPRVDFCTDDHVYKPDVLRAVESKVEDNDSDDTD